MDISLQCILVVKMCAFCVYIQLIEELNRASYTLSEGDAAAFLPSKSYGILLFC